MPNAHPAKRPQSESELYHDKANDLLRRTDVPLPFEEIEAKLEPEIRRAYPTGGDSYLLRPIANHAHSVAALLKFVGEGDALKGKRILHLAEGYAELATYLRRNFGVNSFVLDASKRNIDVARRALGSVPAMVGNAKRIPQKDAFFNAVVSQHFLFSEYPSLDNLENVVLAEVRRTLVDGGHLILVNPVQSTITAFLEGKSHDLGLRKESTHWRLATKWGSDFSPLNDIYVLQKVTPAKQA